MATGNKKTCNAQYWAVGYTNGGANEERLGPFTEQSDAIKAGMVEQGKTRGFTLSGVVDESGKYVYSNAKACNAKFKIGDKVISKSRKYLGPAKITDETDDEYIVKFDNGMRDMLEKDDVVAANSALNAKFKVGDKVKFWVFDKKADGTVKKVVGEKVTVDDGKGNEVEFPSKDLEVWNAEAKNPAACTNSVVANAMAARNALERFSVGDRVYVSRIVDKRKGIVGGDYGTVIKAGPYYSDVRLDSGETLKEVAEPDMRHARNSEGAVARNSEASDVAYKAGNLFKDAYEALAGCEHYLERLSTLGMPNDVKGNDAKTAAWAKDKLRKVSDLKSKLDQGRL